MNDERIDLSTIDPTQDDAGFEHAVSAIMSRASDELVRRRAAGRPLAAVTEWYRPALAAAAVVAFISVAGLASTPPSAGEPTSDVGIAEAVGVPRSLVPFVRGDAPLSVANILVGMGEER